MDGGGAIQTDADKEVIVMQELGPFVMKTEQDTLASSTANATNPATHPVFKVPKKKIIQSSNTMDTYIGVALV